MNDRHLPSLLLVLATVAVTLLGLYLFMESLTAPWEGWTLGKSGMHQEYCELNDLEAKVRQPSNSWSNFIYLFFGLMVVRFVWIDRHNKKPSSSMASFPSYGILLALTFTGLCFGSFLFHASLTHIGQRWDMTFTYGLSVVLLAAGMYRLGVGRFWENTAKSQTVLVLLVVCVDILFYLFQPSLNGKVVLPILFLGVIAAGFLLVFLQKRRFNIFYPIVATSLLIAAILIRELDVAKVGCDPDSIFQGHALWHILTGLSAFLTYQFLRKEKAVSNN